MDFNDQTPMISKEHIQQTLKDFSNEKILCSVDYFRRRQLCQCHIYSLPYQLTIYEDITNNFPGGIHQSVRRITLFDEYPFEHEFFLRIAQSFPFLEDLIVKNSKREEMKVFKLLSIPALRCLISFWPTKIITNNFYMIRKHPYQVIFLFL